MQQSLRNLDNHHHYNHWQSIYTVLMDLPHKLLNKQLLWNKLMTGKIKLWIIYSEYVDLLELVSQG